MQHQKISLIFSYFSAFTVNLVAFSLGNILTWSSPVLPKLNGASTPDHNPLGSPITYVEESLLTALFYLAGMLGPILAGISANKLGRKKTITFLAFPFILSLLMFAFAKTIILFYIGRFIAGLGAGSVFSILPMYLAEIAEDHNRGTFGCLMSISIAFGSLFTFAVGPFLTVQNFCLVGLTPLVIFVPVFSLWNPESPYYFAAVKKHEELKNSLTRLRNRNPAEIEREALSISNMVEELNQNKINFQHFFTIRTLRTGLLLSSGLISFQQLSGYGVITAYTQTIFSATGGIFAPEVSSIIIGTVQLIFVSISSTMVDRLGRRILLLVSNTGCCLSLLSLGLYFFFQERHYAVDAVSWLPVFCLIVFMITFSVGLGPVPWTVMAEVFTPNVKFTASTITTVVCFGVVFIETLVFPSLSVNLGMAATFWIFAVICACGFVFVYLVLPETKGKSLSEIQKLLK